MYQPKVRGESTKDGMVWSDTTTMVSSDTTTIL